MDDFIEYRLPETVLVIRGTRVERTDTALTDDATHGKTVRTQAEVSLETEAHAKVLAARIDRGRLTDTNVTLEFTEDRRLTSASSEADGQGSKVVLGIVGAAAGAAGLASGLFPPTAAAAGVVSAAAGRDASLLAETRSLAADSLAKKTGETDQQLKDEILAAADGMSDADGAVVKLFLAEKEKEALERQRFANRVRALLGDLAKALWDVDQAGTDAALRAATARVKRCRAMLGVAREELALRDAVFEAWHADKVEEKRTHEELRLPLGKVLEAVGESPPADDADVIEVRRVLSSLGLWLTVTHPDSQDGAKAGTSLDEILRHCMQVRIEPGEPDKWARGVVLRQPRRLSLNLYQRYDGADPTSNDRDRCTIRPGQDQEDWRLVESRRCSVADDKCRHEFVPFRKSWWGKKTVGLDLWPSGGLKKYSSTSASQAAAIAGAAADVQSTAGGALKDSASLFEQLDGLQSRGDSSAAELANVKFQVELKTWQLARDGLNATPAQVGQLELLKQQLAMLQARADIDELLGSEA